MATPDSPVSADVSQGFEGFKCANEPRRNGRITVSRLKTLRLISLAGESSTPPQVNHSSPVFTPTE